MKNEVYLIRRKSRKNPATTSTKSPTETEKIVIIRNDDVLGVISIHIPSASHFIMISGD